jgi:dihydropteroate synthase
VRQNFALLARQNELLAAGHPLVVGWSRKSSLGAVTGLPVNERLAPSVAAALLAVERGAHVVRVHDVKQTLAALKVRDAMLDG